MSAESGDATRSLSALDWRLVPHEARDGATHMALDEVAAETVEAGGPATVRVYDWAPSTLSLGYAQDEDSIDWAYCEREDIHVTRRRTGGGAIYHDARGDVACSVVVPADAVPDDLGDCYDLLCEPLLTALEELGVPVGFPETKRPAVHRPACYLRALDPAHDVVGPDGRKLSGNAQYRRREAVVQHGSLTVTNCPERHCGVFAADCSPDAFRERVGGVRDYVDVDRSTVVATLREALADWSGATAAGWTDDELATAARFVEERYGADPWVRRGELPD